MFSRRPSRLQASSPSGSDSHPTRLAAFTLPELVVVLFVLSILLALVVIRFGPAADRAAVRSAAADAASVFVAARSAAIYRRAPVGVIIDTVTATVFARVESALLVRRNLDQGYGVRISATRDSMAFDPRGLGIGAANLSLITRRGRAADTVFVSRLGRPRY